MARIETYLKRQPRCWVKKTHGSAYSAGIPDLIGCWNGRLIGIEVKRPGEEPTALQIQTIKDIRAAGGFAVWADRFEDIQAFVRELKSRA